MTLNDAIRDTALADRRKALDELDAALAVAQEIAGYLAARIPAPGEPDDIGFDDEHAALDALAAIVARRAAR